MSNKKEYLYHFYQLASERAETLDVNGFKKLSFISEEHNTELIVFLWIDENNEIDTLQFFYFEKVIEWSNQSGLTTYITNRLQSPETLDQIGIHKGTRTLELIDDPTMVNEVLKILDHSIFPLGIKDILKLRIKRIP